MSSASSDKRVIAVSSRALLDLDDSHQVFVEHGVDAYYRYQIEHEEDVLEPGIALP
jgi:5'-nucleotidase